MSPENVRSIFLSYRLTAVRVNDTVSSLRAQSFLLSNTHKILIAHIILQGQNLRDLYTIMLQFRKHYCVQISQILSL